MEWNPNCWANLEGSYMLVNWGPCNKNWSITQIKHSPLGIYFIGLDICCSIVQIQKSNGALGCQVRQENLVAIKVQLKPLYINIRSICWMLHKYSAFLFSLGITFIFTVPSLTFYDILFSLLHSNFECFFKNAFIMLLLIFFFKGLSQLFYLWLSRRAAPFPQVGRVAKLANKNTNNNNNGKNLRRLNIFNFCSGLRAVLNTMGVCSVPGLL